MGTIFKQEIGFGLLGEFAKCLNCELANENPSKESANENGSDISTNQEACSILNILEKLSETNRFKLTVDFLSKKEKDDLKGIFEQLNKVFEGDSEKLSSLESVQKVHGFKK